jgi:hypothetical protein
MKRVTDGRWVYVGAVAMAILAFATQLLSQGKAVEKWMAPGGLELHNVKAETVSYLGKQAVRLTDTAPPTLDDSGRFAVVPGTAFQDGTIDVELSGDVLPTALATARGFVGIAFRVSGDRSHFECFYIRPTNGRADDQLRRNHSLQYISMPGFGWEKLRNENPGVYESYADLVPAQWTQLKVQVAGTHAKLFVNGAAQPALIVNDLKQPVASGAVAFWVGVGTVAHFAGLKVTQ